jgi:hypothetical protein
VAGGWLLVGGGLWVVSGCWLLVSGCWWLVAGGNGATCASVEGDWEAVILGDVIVIAAEALFLIVHAVLEQSGFDTGVTRDTPVGGGELMDEIGFGFGLRAKVVEIIVELGLVLVGEFIEEHDGLGGESVSEGVEGGLLRGASG